MMINMIKDKLVCAYNSKSREYENVINLLLLKDNDKFHFAWIKDYSKLQCMNYKTSKMYWCSQCLNVAYESQDKSNEHL